MKDNDFQVVIEPHETLNDCSLLNNSERGRCFKQDGGNVFANAIFNHIEIWLQMPVCMIGIVMCVLKFARQ